MPATTAGAPPDPSESCCVRPSWPGSPEYPEILSARALVFFGDELALSKRLLKLSPLELGGTGELLVSPLLVDSPALENGQLIGLRPEGAAGVEDGVTGADDEQEG